MNPEEQALLMQIMGQHEMGPPVQANFEDPEAVWQQLRDRFGLTEEQVQELRLRAPDQGPGLAERLERLRPQMNLGPLELMLEGSLKEPRVEGRLRF